MAITLNKDDTRFTGIDSSGKRTATRSMVFGYASGDDTMDLAESSLLPKVGDVHPSYTAWTVQSVGEPSWSDSPRIFSVNVTYSMGGSSGGGSVSSKGKKPWELGPQNFQSSTYEIEEPLLQLWDKDKSSYIPLVNTAGDRILATVPKTVQRITFQLHYKHTEGSTKKQNTNYSYNSSSETVCNITIPPYAGKLLPFSTTLHTIYKENGEVDYQYETAEITIDIRNGDTWLLKYLNVGTQAIWGSGETSFKGAAYRYHELTSSSATPTESNMEIGSLEDALAAKKVYTDAGGKAGNFPIEEITEPFPLDSSGGFDETAYSSGGEYVTVSGYPKQGESWNKFDLPKSI